MVSTSPEEAYRKFDDLSAKYIEALRKLTKQIQVRTAMSLLPSRPIPSMAYCYFHICVAKAQLNLIVILINQDARVARDNELIKANLKKYDEELERYIPVLMAQVREDKRGLTCDQPKS